jgi:hypothetical protein
LEIEQPGFRFPLFDKCLVLANMDGPDPDSGTWGVWIRLQEKADRCLPYRFPQIRRQDSTSYNLMLTESSNQVVDVSQDLDDDEKIAPKRHQALMRLDPRIAVEA